MPISTALGSSALLPAGLGFRNAIINGDFRVNQRGLTSTGTVNGSALANGNYGHDRWNIGFAGGTVTYSSQIFATGNAIPGYEPTNYARVVTSGQSAGNYTQFVQRIENVRTFAGQTITISFWAKADTSRNIAIELQQNFGSGGSAGLLHYVRQVALTTSWVKYAFQYNVPSISGKTIGTGNDHYLSFAPFFSAGTGFESRTGSLGIQNGTVEMWGVQIEQNYQPTPFEQRPIGVELSLCQRYYETGTSWLRKQNNDTLRSSYEPIYFKVTKRSATNSVSSTVLSATNNGGTSAVANDESTAYIGWTASSGLDYTVKLGWVIASEL